MQRGHGARSLRAVIQIKRISNVTRILFYRNTYPLFHVQESLGRCPPGLATPQAMTSKSTISALPDGNFGYYVASVQPFHAISDLSLIARACHEEQAECRFLWILAAGWLASYDLSGSNKNHTIKQIVDSIW
jgi:hypothetical protein